MRPGPAFARMPVAVFGDRRLSVRDMRVLGVLYAHANAAGACWPSLAAIADMAALDRRDAQRTLRRLEATGWVEIDQGTGRGRSSSYRVPPAIDERAGTDTVVSPEKRAGGCTPKGRVDTHKRAGGSTPKGRVASPARNRPRTDHEPTKEHTNARGARDRRALSQEQQARFTRFWSVYPRRVAKREAEKAWRALDPDDRLTDRICAAVERARQSEQWRRDGGRYIPHPATWLRRGSWEDEDEIRIEPLVDERRGRDGERVDGTVTALQSLFGGPDGSQGVQSGDHLPVRRVRAGGVEGAGGGVLGPAGEPGCGPVHGGGEGLREPQPVLPDGG
ncbi:MAG: helix-turn-helix domain-containing protein [Spiribacter salinus]|uniref:Helix-turn-helix domain-containing protein n=1 Tax=Spiribacter salinus TaxID=1335746 RepID=A0A540VTX0_9GAMM|nr:MAG: helix-turn-helix domain-containing protein [Spiribacter salinus]